MPDKFQNKYRIPSARASWWDYGQNAAYFVTLCTQNRECLFGNIENGEMKLSPLGEFARQCYLEIPDHFPFVILDEFIIMPDHIHGIVIIDKPETKNNNGNNDTTVTTVETQNFASLHGSKNKNTFGPQSQNLASIVRGFKIGVTKFAKSHNIDFKWQSRFYDHIIRDKESYQKIKNYIISNPGNWITDKFKN